MGSANGKTIRLNVGGTKYEAARSTVEKYPDTMLARMISDTWQQQKDGKAVDEELFIDSDGLQFRFVLEYMRHQTVNLPFNISKEAVLKDLEYFGFRNVPPDAITCSGANIEAANHMRMCRLAHNKNVRGLQQSIQEQKMLKDFTEIAFDCFQLYSQGEERFFNEVHHKRYLYDSVSKKHKSLTPEAKAALNKCLGDYGLRYVAHDWRGVQIAPLKDE